MTNQNRNPAGRPKGSKNKISIQAQLQALETELGQPLEEVMAATFKKLYTDFMQDLNVKEFLTFAQFIMSRVMEKVQEEVQHTIKDETDAELDAKLKAYLSKNQGEKDE
jgi:predicted lipid-binding transport protein (Tim44 family)